MRHADQKTTMLAPSATNTVLDALLTFRRFPGSSCMCLFTYRIIESHLITLIGESWSAYLGEVLGRVMFHALLECRSAVAEDSKGRGGIMDESMIDLEFLVQHLEYTLSTSSKRDGYLIRVQQ